MSVTALARQPDIGLHGRLDALVRPEFRVDVGLQSPGERFAGWETGWKRSGRAVAARSPQDAFVHGAVRLSDADAFSACCRSCGSLKRVSSCSSDSG